MLLTALAGAAPAQQGPEVSLDATALVSDIRATRSVAVDVESSLSTALQAVAEQTRLLKDADCEPGSNSGGCKALKDSLRDDYLAVLNKVEQRLPALRDSVQTVVNNIEVRMGQQTGSTATELQNELLGAQSGTQSSSKPSLQGVSGSRLSQSLSRLQSLVSTASSSGASLRTIQADLYLDMSESLTVIENLTTDIQRTRLLAELQLGDIKVGYEEQTIARQAQLYLFGGTDTTPVVPSPLDAPESLATEKQRSPLEL